MIPFYNVSGYLQECIQSVLSQTYRNFKVILIDDGSTDGSTQIAQGFQENDRVLLVLQANKGVSSARNAGIEIAIRESSPDDFVVFLDSDDALSESYLDSIVRVLRKHPKVEVFIGSAHAMSQDGRLLKRGNPQDEDKTLSGMEYLLHFKGSYPSYVGGGVVKIALLKAKKVRFIEGIVNEDLHFGFEVFRHAEMIGFFDDVFFYRQREGSISCARTFFTQHGNELIFRSYTTNAHYLLSLLEDEGLSSISPLVKRSLEQCAQIPILCWLKDPFLCDKKDLAFLLPYMTLKTKLAYYFPMLARRWVKAKNYA